jgi:zinc protease
VTRTTLDTGLRVVIVERHARPVVTVNLVLSHGALSDPPDSGGITYLAVKLASDFYEPMGVNDAQSDERSFRRRVVDLGGWASFDVESDYSLVQIAGYARDTPRYLQMIAEVVREPRHGNGSFNARRNAALDAIESIESEDPQALQQLIAKSAFGQEHPYARSLLGTTESLGALELQEVMEHQRVVFVPAGATLLIVGDLQPDKTLSAVRKWLGNWQGWKDLHPMPSVPAPSLPRAPGEIGFLERHAASTLLTCAMRPLREVAGTDPALRVLTNVLGGGIGSRLGTTLRERNGLTYGAHAEIIRRHEANALIACAPLQGEKADLGVRFFRGILEELRESPPTDDEVRRAKSLCLAELDSSYDDAGAITREWLRAITLGSGVPQLEKERAAIERVTVQDVRRLARSLFRLKTFRWVVSGDARAARQAFEVTRLGKLKPFAPGS